MARENVSITLNDADSADKFGIPEDTIFVSLESSFVNYLPKVYDAWSDFWNGGEGYEEYADFVEEWGDNEFIKTHFDAFHDKGMDSWYLSTFISLFDAVYPEANIKVVEADSTFNFTY